MLATGRGLAEHHHLRGASTEHHLELGVEVAAQVDVALVDRQLGGGTQRHADRQHRDLVDRVGLLFEECGQGVAAFVVGHRPLLRLVQAQAGALTSDGVSLPGLLQVAHADLVGAAPHGDQGGLVDQVLEVRAAHPRRAARQGGQVRARACSRSRMRISSEPPRTAIRAASLIRFLRSAPLIPGVPRARVDRSASGPMGLPLVCTPRISMRSSSVGSGTTIWRSNRPGRCSAGSSTSGRLVAAMITTPALPSKPSISPSSWLRVCSRSSCPPPRPAPRLRPMESSSSMNTMQGALALAVLNRSRTRLAPTPTNISMKSEPVTVMKGTPASPAVARASSVLPVPGGPTSSMPLGTSAPALRNLSGSRRNAPTPG